MVVFRGLRFEHLFISFAVKCKLLIIIDDMNWLLFLKLYVSNYLKKLWRLTILFSVSEIGIGKIK